MVILCDMSSRSGLETVVDESDIFSGHYIRIKRLLPEVYRERAMIRALIIYRLVLRDQSSASYIEKVVRYGGITEDDLKFGRKSASLSVLRAVAAHAYRCSGLSYPKTAKKLGGKNHTSIIGACNLVDEAIAKYKEIVDSAFDGKPVSSAKDFSSRIVGIFKEQPLQHYTSSVGRDLDSLNIHDRNLVMALIAREIILRNGALRLSDVTSRLASLFGVNCGDIERGLKYPDVSAARGVAMHIFREYFALSYSEIAKRFPGRKRSTNHSSVISSCKRVERAIQMYSHIVKKAFPD